MRIGIAHSRYLSGPISGENRVVEDEASLLREAGHEVFVWSPIPEAESKRDLLRVGAQSTWSLRATKELTRLATENDLDVVHFHNLFPLVSPAGIRAVASKGVATVMTLHNYRLLCLPAVFVRDERVCEDCLGHVPWRGVVHRCYRGSALGSASLALSLSLHRAIGTFERMSLFFAGSRFVRDKHVQAGIDPARIEVKPNFVWPLERRKGPGEYYLYLGRMSPEKGIDRLVAAWRSISSPLLVVGDGPQLEGVRRIAPPNVRFTGGVEPGAVPELVQGARAVMIPSVTYESAPRAVLEAYSAGVPVIASRIGALPEVVEDSVTGILADPFVASDWPSAVRTLDDDRASEAMGGNAWNRWRENHSPEQGLKGLEHGYREAMKR